MSTLQRSRLRVCVGLALAIIVAPVGTALCIELAILLSPGSAAISLSDQVGGSLTFLVIAMVFGAPIALLPGLMFGGATIAFARFIGTRSPVFYAAAGLLAGAAMAFLDTERTKGAFTLWEAVPFFIGGALAALTYWAVAER